MPISNPVVTVFPATTGWTQALAASKDRIYLVIQNISGGQVEIGFAGSAPTYGELLADGMEYSVTGNEVPIGAVWIKGAQAGNLRISVVQ